MEIRPLTADDLDAALDSNIRAFGPVPAADRDAWRSRVSLALPEGRLLGAFDGGRLVATSRVLDFRQWWHGRAVSMGGVAGVTVAPEARGRGIGRRIVTAALELCAAKGHAVSVLFPATTRIYRSLGWEHAGGFHKVRLRTEALRTLDAAPVPVRRATPQDAAEVGAVLRRVHGEARDSGPVDWTVDMWRHKLSDEDLFSYLAEDGFLAYRWQDGRGESLRVEKLVAGSEATLRALAAIVGSGSSIAEHVTAALAPGDPLLWLLGEREVDQLERTQWMFRLVDAPAAIEARGYPEGVTADVPLAVEDLRIKGNSASWRLIVADGRGRLEPAADDPAAVRVGARGLAALYAGVPVATLRRAGLAEGGTAGALEALGAVFAGAAFSLDYF
ncbi:GNAT family N-acetyltransferase [Actinomadura hibisca]|uniref:GNAT family N-acetyltransferase n=1 Tax=Actinomadura hibisca TaxID=68565 RepID=UPI00082ED0F8|nr:GNAT family N-acetyltransferase [Actinomadura hibisca]